LGNRHINRGGPTGTLIGIVPKTGDRAFATGLRDNPDASFGAFSDERLNTKLFLLDKPILERLRGDPAILDQEAPKNWEELRSLNISIAAGEVKTLYFVCVVAPPNEAINGVLFNLQLLLSPGKELDLTKAVFIGSNTMGAAA
jgi:hypothetical protein